MLPLESVPNLSEGRDQQVVAELGRRFIATGVRLLDVHRDGDHNRSVLTLVGGDDELVDALVAGIAAARERIDLRRHEGIHPRVGAVDVVPLVPLGPGDESRAIAAAHAVGQRVGSELGIPVFLYGLVGEGRPPAFFRRGGPEELQRRLDVGELAPTYGPQQLDAAAGAVLVGARAPLVAFNLALDGCGLDTARAIAAAVRGSSGGMPGVQALGLQLSDGTPQVSTNVVDLDVAAVHELVARVRAEAAARGATVRRSELVGLMPARVARVAAQAAGFERPSHETGFPTPDELEAARVALALPSLAPDRVLEWHLRTVGGESTPRQAQA